MKATKLNPRSVLPVNAQKGDIAHDITNGYPVVYNGTEWVPLVQFAVTASQLSSPADQCFFIASKACKVTAISEVHAVAGTDGSAVNLQVTKDEGTEAPGAGDNLLTDNTNAGFNLKGTANTVQNGTLTGTSANLLLAAGDRLSLDYAGTLTSLAGVQVTVTLVYLE